MLTFKLKLGKKYKVAVPGLEQDYIFETKGKTQTISLKVEEPNNEPELDTRGELNRLDNGLSQLEASELIEDLHRRRIERLRERTSGRVGREEDRPR